MKTAARYVSLAEDKQAKSAMMRGRQSKSPFDNPATQLNLTTALSLFKLDTVLKRLPFRIQLSIGLYEGLRIDFFSKRRLLAT